MAESVVSSGLFVCCVCRKKPRREESSLGGPTALGLGVPAWAIRVDEHSSFPGYRETKADSARKGREGRRGEIREGTGPAELSSFSGPATNSRTRESVWTAQLTEPFRPMSEPRLRLPALRGATHPSFSPGGKGRGCSNAAKRNPQLEKQTDESGEPGFWSIFRGQSRGRQLTGVKTRSPSLQC